MFRHSRTILFQQKLITRIMSVVFSHFLFEELNSLDFPQMKMFWGFPSEQIYSTPMSFRLSCISLFFHGVILLFVFLQHAEAYRHRARLSIEARRLVSQNIYKMAGKRANNGVAKLKGPHHDMSYGLNSTFNTSWNCTV